MFYDGGGKTGGGVFCPTPGKVGLKIMKVINSVGWGMTKELVHEFNMGILRMTGEFPARLK